MGRYARRLVLVFALTNAVLYACFLPLWEGFDEPFHYGYVESLAVQGRFPVFGQSKVSEEINASFLAVPLTRMLSGTIPGALSFEEWSRLSPDVRFQRMARLNTVGPDLRGVPSNLENYEAQQAPLAYIILAPFDMALARVAIRWRVLALRVILSFAAVLLLWFGLARLCALLRLADNFALAALSCIFGSQMLWATVAHIGNDALAVPLTLLFLTWLGIASENHARRNVFVLPALFAAGLLTKAYFLAFAPVFIACLVIRFLRDRNRWPVLIAFLIPVLTAGPWYLHNRIQYGSFSGTQQSVAGIGFTQALSVVPRIPWLNSTLAFLHWSLWTGNWSFLSFSKATLNAELLLFAAAFVIYFVSFRQVRAPEWWMLAATACFIGGLIYQTCVTYIHTHGASLFAEPWYWQGVVCFLWVIAFRGLAQSQRVGRALGAVTVLLVAWITAVTYVAKLFPLYGGDFEPATLMRVWRWWSTHPTQDLATVALAPAPVLYTLLAVLAAVLAVQTMVIVRGLLRTG